MLVVLTEQPVGVAVGVGVGVGVGVFTSSLIGEGILLVYTVDGHPPVILLNEVLGGQRRGVVVVAHIVADDPGVGLSRQRADHVRDGR